MIGLKQLTHYAVKVVGVANLKIGTALKVINEHYNDNGISRSTFKRMIVKAKKIGLLIVHELKRDSGGQSSNLYVFMPFPALNNDQEKTQVEQPQHLRAKSNLDRCCPCPLSISKLNRAMDTAVHSIL